MRAPLVIAFGLVFGGCYICPGRGGACHPDTTVELDGPMVDGDYHIVATTDAAQNGDCQVHLVCASRTPQVTTCATAERPLRMSVTCGQGIATVTVETRSLTGVGSRPTVMNIHVEHADGTTFADHSVRLREPADDGCGGEAVCNPVLYVDL